MTERIDHFGPPDEANFTPLRWPIEETPTDAGDARRLYRLVGDKVRFVDSTGRWLVWDGQRWQPTTQVRVLALTEEAVDDIRMQAEVGFRREEADGESVGPDWWKHAANLESMRKRRAVVDSLAALPAVQVDPDQLDRNPDLLVLPGGKTLDLLTNEVRDSRPDDLNTRVAGTPFVLGAACKNWMGHIKLITSDDIVMAAYLRRWAGYLLTGSVSEQQFLFPYGEGNNGKNVFIETLMLLLGEYAMRGSVKIITAGVHEHETIIADLAGMRMVYVDEAPQGRINEERIKELTGSKRLRARKMRQDTFEFDASFKLVIAGNNMPRVRDTSEGFWRRAAPVPFDAVIPADKRVKNYAELLFADEGPGILNWCVEGLKDYHQLGGLGEPPGVTRARNEYRTDENEFGRFVSESFDVMGPHVWQPNNVLYAGYSSWCQENGVTRFSMQQLSNDWKRAGFKAGAVARRIWQGWPAPKSRVQRGWVGPPLLGVPTQLAWQEVAPHAAAQV